MIKFIQLSKDFDIQESNWIRGVRDIGGPVQSRDSTQLLIASAREKSETSSEYVMPFQKLDFNDFDALLLKLRPIQLQIYKLSTLGYYIDSLNVYQPRPRKRWEAFGLSEYKYNETLRVSIENIKRWGGLA